MDVFLEKLEKYLDKAGISKRAASINAGLSEDFLRKAYSRPNASIGFNNAMEIYKSLKCMPHEVFPDELFDEYKADKVLKNIDPQMLQDSIEHILEANKELGKEAERFTTRQLAVLMASQYELRLIDRQEKEAINSDGFNRAQ